MLCATIFIAPETKAQVHHCDYALSVVRPSYLTFHILDFSSEATERNSTKHDSKQDLIILFQACVFPGWSEKQDGRPGRSVKKVAFGTQVHDLWPFGPLVLSWIYSSCFTLYIGKLLLLCKHSARYLFSDNEIQYVHFGLYIDTYISLHIFFKFLLPLFFFLASPNKTQKLVSPYTFRIFDFFWILVDSSTLPKKGLWRYS